MRKGLNVPKVIRVIESETTRGEGVEEDPMRIVKQYFTLDGKFLAEFDHYEEDKKEQNNETNPPRY